MSEKTDVLQMENEKLKDQVVELLKQADTFERDLRQVRREYSNYRARCPLDLAQVANLIRLIGGHHAESEE